MAERDNPPPVVLSHEPAAVEVRVRAWLAATHRVRDARDQLRLARMLLALLEAPECSTAELAATVGHRQRQAARMAGHLEALGLTESYYRGIPRYHCLLPAAEDALLLVVAGGELRVRSRVCHAERSAAFLSVN